MKQLLCRHDWRRIGDIKHLWYDEHGQQVVTATCQCYKCGEMKDRKFLGTQVKNIFD